MNLIALRSVNFRLHFQRDTFLVEDKRALVVIDLLIGETIINLEREA